MKRHTQAAAALGAVLGVTLVWWTLALWPLPDAAPEWLVRTRDVCFGTAPSGLPEASGWMVLILQPLSMVALVFAIWGADVAHGVAALGRVRSGRVLRRIAGIVMVAGVLAAGHRIGTATAALRAEAVDRTTDPAAYPRLDLAAPPLDLVNQHGDTVTWAAFAGRATIVTFAFGHCETVCPLIVRDVLEARRRSGRSDVAIVVLTLDPWRDVPSRLSHLARQWRLESGDVVLGGSVARVEAALDAWQVTRLRDERTGDVTHPRLAYIVGPAGRIAYGVSGGMERLGVHLARVPSGDS